MVTPDNQIPEAVLQPVRRRGTVLRSIESLNSEEKEALHQEFSKTLEKLSKHPDDGYIQKRHDILEKIDPNFQGSEKLLEEKRLIEKLLVEEELDSGAVRKFRITLQSIQKELSNISEEACRPTKFQRSGSPSNDGGPGNSSASQMKASRPKMACLSTSKMKAAKEQVITIGQPPPTPIRSENNGGLVVAAGTVGALIFALWWCNRGK